MPILDWVILYASSKARLRYLKVTIHLALTCDQKIIGQIIEERECPSPFGLIGYADSNFAGDPEDRKSVMGYCFFIGGALVSWSSKKQRTSITEAEYIALGHASREGVWIRRFLNEIAPSDDLMTDVLINGDNESSLSLTKNSEAQNRTKHIDVQHHYIRELINEKEQIVAWVPSARMLADGFTKALTIDTFKRHRSLLGLN